MKTFSKPPTPESLRLTGAPLPDCQPEPSPGDPGGHQPAQSTTPLHPQPACLHQLDLLIDDRVVVELKAVRKIESAHFAVVRSYLRALDLRDGLILNFALPRLEVKRVGPVAGA